MKKKLLNKWTIVGLIILLLVVSTSLYFQRKSSTSVQYITTTLAKSDLTVSVSASGSVVAAKQQNANFQTAGKLAEIDVNVGDHVSVGQTLAKLDLTQLQSQVTQSEVAVDEAENNLKNNGLSNQPTQYDIANLQEAINQAQIKVNNDTNAIAQTQLMSQMNGIIQSVNNSVGDTVTGTTTSVFLTMTDTNGANSKNISFPTQGRISEIDVSAGQHVTSGQLLGKLDDTTQQNQLNADSSQLNIANNNLKNKYVTGLPTQYSTANLKDAVTVSETKLASDKASLQNGILKSNVDGIVASINGNVGDNVSGTGSTSTTTTASTSSQPLMVILDPGTLDVSLQVDEADIAKCATIIPCS